MDWFAHKKSRRQVIFGLDDSLLLIAIAKQGRLFQFDSVVLETINADTLCMAVSMMVERYHLIGAEISLVLSDTYYQLLMTDQLAVPEAEMASALRWKMKGLLEIPSNEALLETLVVPAHGLGEKRKKVLVVAAEKAFLTKCIHAFEKALIPLSFVGIELFSLRNLSIFNAPGKQTQLLLSLSNSQCLLTVLYDKNIYLVRKPKIDPIALDNSLDEQLFEQILLEIHRSTDYCLSELKLPAPKEVILSPAFLMQGALANYLNKHLEQTLRTLDLNEMIQCDKVIPLKFQQALFLNVGLMLEQDLQEKQEMIQEEVDATAS